MPTLERRIRHLIVSRYQSLPLPGMEHTVAERAKRIADYLRERRSRLERKCDNCSTNQGRKNIWGYHFDSPFDEKGTDHYYCSEECREYAEGSDGYDFAYRNCESCDRYICERCPSNGWHEYFRYSEEHGQECLKCYEERILDNGIDAESFTQGKIKGMFFSFGNPELAEKGYQPVPGFTDYFIRGSASVKEYCTKALELIGNKNMVITGYESMGLGGGEGTVSMYSKPITEEN